MTSSSQPAIMRRDAFKLSRMAVGDKATALADASAQLYQQRQAAVEKLDCNLAAGLPVSDAGDRIRELIANHQVVIVAGETGSGKTTQLPKICLQAGMGSSGMIGHTQPRRIAARTVAQRIAQETGAQLGREVGFAVRFSDQTRDDTLVKVMTDGLLLAEIRHDRFLEKYDAIIVDEAHERSLNIDFLLGFLHRLIQKRRDLKVIVTSATIDVARFSNYFGNKFDYGSETPVVAGLVLSSPDGEEAAQGVRDGAAGEFEGGTQNWERDAATYQPQLLAMKDAGVTDVYTVVGDTQFAQIIQEMDQVGLEARVWGTNAVVTSNLIDLVGELAEGALAVTVMTGLNADVPGLVTFREEMAAAGAIRPRNVHGGISVRAIFRNGQEIPQPTTVMSSSMCPLVSRDD